MNKTLLAILIICASMRMSSQSLDVESFRNKIKATKNTTERLAIIDSLLFQTFRKNDSVFIEYSIQYIELAKSIDSIDLAAKKAMNLQSVLTFSRNDPKKAIRTIDGVLAHRYKLSDSFLKGGLYLKRGRANERIDFNEAIKDYDLAILNFGKKDSVYVADAYLFKGRAFSNLGKFVPAGENYENAYSYFESLQDYEYMLYAKQGIITMFSKNGFYDKAKKERDDLIEKITEVDKRDFLALEHYNQSYDYKKQGKKSLQLASLEKAKEYLPFARDNKSYQMLVYSALAEYYSEEGKMNLASVNIAIIDDLFEEVKGDVFAISNYFSAKANFHYGQGEYKEALTFAAQNLAVSQQMNLEEDIMFSHRTLAKIYKKKGDFKKGLESEEIYNTIRDSLYNSSTANSLAYYQTLYETEKREKELFETSANVELLEQDAASFKKQVYIISLSVLLCFGLLLLYRNQRTLKYNKMLQEQFSQELLISQEEERKRISKDLHDGLGQSLLLIKNKIIATGDSATKKMVDTAIEEVRTISRDLHPFQLQEMGVTKAIEYSLNQIDENTTLFISSEIENIDNIFSPEQEVNIYRIVQESLNNIIKHANAEACRVSVKKLFNGVNIIVKDNGVGFDFNEKYQDIKSLGLKTLLERTKVLNGQMRVESRAKGGTLIEFQLPVS